MKPTKISVNILRKLNLGNYSSVDAEVGVWAELEEGDDIASCLAALRTVARNHVMTELARHEPRLQTQTKDLFMGIPISKEGDKQ